MSTVPLSPAPLSPRDANKALAARQFARVNAAVGIAAIAVVLAVVLRTLILEPFNIPSDSMLPTLAAGDYLFVAKWPYGFGRYSLPLALPWPAGRIGGSLPQRGDIVVFKTPRDNRTDFIKRVIGLPGDRVRLTGGRVELNGVLVPRVPDGDFTVTVAAGTACSGGTAPATRGVCRYPRFVETINGRRYAVLDEIVGDPGDDTPLVTVPAGHYFTLGDNRDDSADSRMTIAEGGVGMVPAANLIGRAEIVIFSTGSDGLRLDRVGTRL
jgi:signal peptidase I